MCQCGRSSSGRCQVTVRFPFLNTASGREALYNNTTGEYNTASGRHTLYGNTTGFSNTAIGADALNNNTTGSTNTAIGFRADVATGNLTNATAIGNEAMVNASNKIRLGNSSVTVIEGQVMFSASSDKTKKENFQSVDGEKVLGKIRGLNCQAGTSLATILNSFATMVLWRKTSMRPPVTTE